LNHKRFIGFNFSPDRHLDAKEIDQTNFDLSVKNPNGGEVKVHRSPADILEEIAALDAESVEVLARVRTLI
jgi:type I restriction enzyme M protein